MSLADRNVDTQSTVPAKELFNELYSGEDRYWWREEGRYDTSADAYPDSLLTQLTLRHIRDHRVRRGARALDLGAGEGADAIRLALLGYRVTAVDFSEKGYQKILRFAREQNVTLEATLADVTAYEPAGEFDIILCNGLLQYIDEDSKISLIKRMQRATRPGGINVISVWSTFSEVPDSHSHVPIFGEPEDGPVSRMYSTWQLELRYFERHKRETSHPTEQDHVHSHIKLIARKPVRRWPWSGPTD
jgi:tellurite methyltransferase